MEDPMMPPPTTTTRALRGRARDDVDPSGGAIGVDNLRARTPARDQGVAPDRIMLEHTNILLMSIVLELEATRPRERLTVIQKESPPRRRCR